MSSLPILVLAPNEWDGPYMNRQQLFSRIGNRRRVLYSNGAWRSHDVGTERWRSAPALGAATASGSVLVDSPPKYLVRRGGVPLLEGVVLRLSARRWRKVLHAEGEPFIAYVFHPKFEPYLKALNPKYVVYHAYDLYERYRGWSEAAADQQRRLLNRADVIIASSDLIGENLSRIAGRSAYVLPNGADVDAFMAAANGGQHEPQDLADIPRPRIGWVGNLNRKVDFDLIAHLSSIRPAWQFVFVGEIRGTDAETELAIGRLRERRNVHFVGPRGHSDVPPYVAAMDVNIMCYRLSSDSWVEACYPLKMHEYLASGQPVVSADLPSVRPFANVLEIATSEDEWLVAIERALAGTAPGSVEERRSVARMNTWDSRVATLESLLDAVPNRTS